MMPVSRPICPLAAIKPSALTTVGIIAERETL